MSDIVDIMSFMEQATPESVMETYKSFHDNFKNPEKGEEDYDSGREKISESAYKDESGHLGALVSAAQAKIDDILDTLEDQNQAMTVLHDIRDTKEETRRQLSEKRARMREAGDENWNGKVKLDNKPYPGEPAHLSESATQSSTPASSTGQNATDKKWASAANTTTTSGQSASTQTSSNQTSSQNRTTQSSPNNTNTTATRPQTSYKGQTLFDIESIDLEVEEELDDYFAEAEEEYESFKSRRSRHGEKVIFGKVLPRGTKRRVAVIIGLMILAEIGIGVLFFLEDMIDDLATMKRKMRYTDAYNVFQTYKDVMMNGAV